MAEIRIHHNKITDPKALISLCPFGAIEIVDGWLTINEACKMCHLCIKKGPEGVFEFVETEQLSIDTSKWIGITVFIEYENGRLHPVSLELLGKARQLADAIDHPVYALLSGSKVGDVAEELIYYGADKVYVYDYPELAHILVEPYTNVLDDFSTRVRPSAILVGGTTIGRSLAPRAAARLGTGLTADCTTLEITENSDLQQIRPAFGGNIMAHIKTSNHRPQFATVRYKIFKTPEKELNRKGEIINCSISSERLNSRVNILEVKSKPKVVGIEEADIVIAAGKAFKKKQDLAMVEKLAEFLNAQVAGTRPTIESGWIDPRRQIGLSGRTVSPRLLIACGVSGSVQFIAGMRGAEVIIAINKDPLAPIFKVAHHGIIGDIYEVLPRIINRIEQSRRMSHAV
jgi:electron transfer flavoprotein alpha subunit